MKDFSIVVRNRSSGKLESVPTSAENKAKAISNVMRTKPNHECMYVREKTTKIKGKK